MQANQCLNPWSRSGPGAICNHFEAGRSCEAKPLPYRCDCFSFARIASPAPWCSLTGYGRTEHRRPPGIPANALPVPGYTLDEAAYWPCAQPDGPGAFMLCVSAHLLGYDQARSFWVWCLIEEDSEAKDWAFVAWALDRRGIIKERPPYDANPLTLYGNQTMFRLANIAHKAIHDKWIWIPQCMYSFADEPPIPEPPQ